MKRFLLVVPLMLLSLPAFAQSKFYVNSTNGNIGIGTSAPITSLDISQAHDAVALPVGTTGARPSGAAVTNGEIRYNSTLPGIEAYINNAWTTLLNTSAVGTITSGVWNGTVITPTYGGTGSNTTFTQGSVVFSGSGGIYSQNNSQFFWDNTNNRLGIGTTTPATGLDLQAAGNTSTAPPIQLRNTLTTSGNFWQLGPDGFNSFIIYNQSNTGVWIANGGTGWNSSSDKRMKENIIPLKDALSKISDINGVTFRWKDKAKGPDEQVGVIAQDVQKVYPQLVSIDNKGMLGVNYAGLVVPLIEAVKQLKVDNEKLRDEFESYKKYHP